MRLPIDTAGMTFLCAIPPTPVVDFATRQQRADENGEPLYAVQLVALGDGGAEVLKVTVAGLPKDMVQGRTVHVEGLIANYWQMNDRSGVSFRAAKIQAGGPVSAGSPAPSSSAPGASAKAS